MPSASSGPVVSSPAAAADSPRSSRMSWSSGGRLPNSGLRLSPVRTTGTASAPTVRPGANRLPEERGRGLVQLGVDQLRLRERLGQRHAVNSRAPQRDHLAVVAL